MRKVRSQVTHNRSQDVGQSRSQEMGGTASGLKKWVRQIRLKQSCSMCHARDKGSSCLSHWEHGKGARLSRRVTRSQTRRTFLKLAFWSSRHKSIKFEVEMKRYKSVNFGQICIFAVQICHLWRRIEKGGFTWTAVGGPRIGKRHARLYTANQNRQWKMVTRPRKSIVLGKFW